MGKLLKIVLAGFLGTAFVGSAFFYRHYQRTIDLYNQLETAYNLDEKDMISTDDYTQFRDNYDSVKIGFKPLSMNYLLEIQAPQPEEGVTLVFEDKPPFGTLDGVVIKGADSYHVTDQRELQKFTDKYEATKEFIKSRNGDRSSSAQDYLRNQ